MREQFACMRIRCIAGIFSTPRNKAILDLCIRASLKSNQTECVRVHLKNGAELGDPGGYHSN